MFPSLLTLLLFSFPFLVRSLDMIKTMSDPPPNEFFQFYHQNFPNQTPPYTSITTNTTPAATLPPESTMMNPSSPTSASNLGPSEGRVSKPIRRRSRASRRTPTTLLNTDTTNFRAMVQQFTGGPIAPFAAAATSSSPPNFSTLAGLGLGPRASHPINQTMMSHPFYQQQLQQQQQQQQYQHYNMYSGNVNTQVGGDDNMFFQRIMSNPRPSNNDNNINNVVSDHIHGGEGGGGFFPRTSSS